MTKTIDDYATEFGHRVALSEYGGGANTHQHLEGPLVQPKPSGPFHPEEWQTNVHEQDWAEIQKSPHVWGSFLWSMFDFQVAGRHEGSQPFLNDKGLVTQDRKTRKDAYFFYQANWADKPMLHIASSTLTPRYLPTTEVQVFSNSPSVELFVNGKSLGAGRPDAVKVFRWPNVALQMGNNEVKAVAGSLTDSCTWELQEGPAPSSAPSQK